MVSWWELIAQQLGAGNARSHERRVAEALGATDAPGRSWAQKITNFIGAQREQGSWTKRAVPEVDLADGVAARSLYASGVLVGGASAPVNLVAPVIAGTPTVGETLTRTAGTWSGSPAPTLSGQWYGDEVALDGETGPTLLLAAEHAGLTIDYVETATNSEGSVEALSNELGPVVAPWAFSGAMARSSGAVGVNYTAGAQIPWDAADDYDIGDWHDPSVENTKFIVPAGVDRVCVYAQVGLGNATTTDSHYLEIRMNDVAVVAQREECNATSPGLACSTDAIEVVPGDYFEARLVVESDTSVDLTATGSYFAIEKVG